MKRRTAHLNKKNASKVSLLIVCFLFAVGSANAQASGPVWTITGNSGTTDANYIGTIDPQPLIFKTSETEWMRISPTGDVGMGTTTPSTQLHTTGGVRFQTLTGTGTRSVVADPNGNLSAGSGTGSGIITGNGMFNYVPKWTPDGATLGNSSIFDNGNIGIGTTNPQANLEVKNGSVLFDGATGNTLVTGGGTRMMWIPEKAAFRAGAVASTEWDNANIGLYSAALGYATTAESYACFVVGRFNRNSASFSKTTWVPTDPLFVVGNGQNLQKTANALTVLKNGNVGIGTPTPVNRFDVSGEISVGGGYAGVKSAPANGAIIRGNVGIGLTNPNSKIRSEWQYFCNRA